MDESDRPQAQFPQTPLAAMKFARQDDLPPEDLEREIQHII